MTLAEEAVAAGQLGADHRFNAAAQQINATIWSLGLDHAARTVAFSEGRRLYCTARQVPLTEVDATWLS